MWAASTTVAYWLIFFPYSPRLETMSVYLSLHNDRLASSHAIVLRVTLGFLWKLSRPFVFPLAFYCSALFLEVSVALAAFLWTLYSNNVCSVAHEVCFGAGLSLHGLTAQYLPAEECPEGWKALRRGTPLESAGVLLNCNSTKQEGVIFVIDEQLKYWCLFL